MAAAMRRQAALAGNAITIISAIQFTTIGAKQYTILLSNFTNW
jgi:hypothetical protein